MEKQSNDTEYLWKGLFKEILKKVLGNFEESFEEHLLSAEPE